MTSFSVMNCRTIERMDGARIAGTLCIDSNHNPEFVAGPRNYGHWLLAFVYPLFNGTSKLLASGQPIDVLLSPTDTCTTTCTDVHMHTFHHKIERDISCSLREECYKVHLSIMAPAPEQHRRRRRRSSRTCAV